MLIRQKGLRMNKRLQLGAVGLLAIIAVAGAATEALAEPKSKPGAQTAPGAGATSPGSAELTAEECTKLGGSVYTAPQCKTTGTRCVIRLAGGQINAPCIDEVAKDKK